MRHAGLVLVLIVSMMSLSQMAHAYDFKLGQSTWKLGGSIRMDAYWDHTDFGDVDTGRAGSVTPFKLEMPTDTNINVSAEYGKLSGYAEIGLNNTLSTEDTSLDSLLEVRQCYVIYDLGSGHSLMFGKAQTCFSEGTPDQRLYNDNGLQGFGDLSSGRHFEIRYRYTHDKWLTQFALEQAKTEEANEIMPLPDDAAGAYIVDAYIPALVFSLGYSTDTFHITPSAYYQIYKLKKNAESTEALPLKDTDITTYGLCIDADVKIDKVTLSGEAWWGQNLSIFDLDLRERDKSTVFGHPLSTTSDSLDNVKSYGGWLQVALQTGNGVARVGGGYQQSQAKLSGEPFEDKISTWGAFVNYQWNILDGLSITPEIAYFNLGKDADKDYSTKGNDLGSDLMFGVHLQYDF